MISTAQRALMALKPTHIFSFALGIACLQLQASLPDNRFSIFLLLIALLVFWRFSRARLCMAFCIGFAFASLQASTYLSQRMALADSGKTVMATVQIVDLPVFDTDQWQFHARVLQSTDYPSLQNKKLKLAWYRTQSMLRSGDIWQMQLMLRVPNGVQNPGGVDSEQRAMLQGFVAQGYVKKIALQKGNVKSIDRWRDGLSQQIRKQLGPDRARFVLALAIGDTRFINDADWDVLRKTGITHLIAISGFHVGIVALSGAYLVLGLYWFFPSLGLRFARPRAVAIVSILCACAYTAMAGFAVPTVRTCIMISVFMLCRLLYRQCSALHALALSMLVILLWQSSTILLPGFCLSFAGVLLLICFMPVEKDQRMLPSFFRAQWVATLGLTPISIGFFGQASVISPLVNMLAIPWISLVVVPIALLGSVFAYWPAVSGVIWNLAASLMQYFWQFLLWAQSAPLSAIYFPEVELWKIVCALLGICILLLPYKLPGRYFSLGLMLPLFMPAKTDLAQGEMRVAMMDVGQGLAVLIRTQHHQLLYDTGAGNTNGFSRGESTVVPALHALAIERLNRVVISHADNDHIGGLEAVRSAIKIDRIDSSDLLAVPDAKSCQQGQSWQWDGVQFRYLWPTATHMESDNDRSCVLQITANGQTVLLTGDIGVLAEMALVEKYAKHLQADVLFVPHHGSKTSSSEEFIAFVNPRWAFVSTGFQNRFKHPRQLVVERYSRQHSVLQNTVANGWTELSTAGGNWHWLTRARVDHHRYWMHETPEQAVRGY